MRYGFEMYCCTTSDFFLGRWAQRWMTRIPVPRADAGGFIIHRSMPVFSHACRSIFRSCGNTNVRGIKPNSFMPNLNISRCRFFHRRSLRPIWKVPGKWFNFWLSFSVWKTIDLMCLPQVPVQSFESVKGRASCTMGRMHR